MLLSILYSWLLVVVGLASAATDFGPTSTCQPQHKTITVTSTSVDINLGTVTQYDIQYKHHTEDVTSVIYLTSTQTETVLVTHYTDPQIVTSFSYLTSTLYRTVYRTSVNTDVATVTSRVLVKNIEVKIFVTQIVLLLKSLLFATVI